MHRLLKILRAKVLLALLATAAIGPALAGSYEDFFRALALDRAEVVSELLAQGFDPNAPDEKGQVGLFIAMRDGSPKTAAVLLAAPGIKVDAANAAGETPLMMAALRGRLEWVRRLLDHGAQVNRAGWSPLLYAASGPEPAVLNELLNRGAHIDALSPNHSSALMMAARYGPEAAVDLLLARGANAALRNDKGLNAADFARLGGRDALGKRLDTLAR